MDQTLNNESTQTTAGAILREIYGYLTSNTLVNLKTSNFEIKATVMSFDHSENYARKKSRLLLPQRPFPQGRVGINDGLGRNPPTRGIIPVRDGFPAEPHAFKNRCLLVAFTMGKILQEEAFKGAEQLKVALQDMRCLAGQIKNASLRQQNAVGKRVIVRMKELIDSLTISLHGPHQFEVLSRLCDHHKVQAVIYSEMLGNTPAYLFPLHQTEPRADRPTLYFWERATIHDQGGKQHHLDVLISPQKAFPYKFNCSLCFRPMSWGHNHQWCPRRVSCYFCRRGLCKISDYWDASMIQTFCP